MAGELESRWPPKSPYEALMSSPRGRDKLRQNEARGTSLSPSKSPSKARSRASKPASMHAAEMESSSDDEEALQLKLEALEARLKLKKLKQRKGLDEREHQDPCSAIEPKSRIEHARFESPSRKLQSDKENLVHIGASPVKRPVKETEPRSPGRVLLGIDKGLKGKDVSLRRPRPAPAADDPFVDKHTPKCLDNSKSSDKTLETSDRPKSSFSRRILENRKRDQEVREKQEQRLAQKSKGFSITQAELRTAEEMREYKSKDEVETAREREDFSRAQVLSALNEQRGGSVKRSHTTIGMTKRAGTDQAKYESQGGRQDSISQRQKSPIRRARSLSPPQATEPQLRESATSNEHFEPFSMMHLQKRTLPQDILTREFEGKSVFRIPELLATVKSPDFELPDDVEADHVVVGIIASKSSPIAHKQTHKATKPTAEISAADEAAQTTQNDHGKFMILTLTDLKWTLDLYLFTTAYTRFYKLIPGTVVAILNPNIMPPPRHKTDTGRFSLTLHSSDDTVLEIGTSRDLGWCKAVRKDGKSCTDWVDKRHTEYCEFHVNRVLERTRAGRMEMQGMTSYAPGGRQSSRSGNFGGSRAGSAAARDGNPNQGLKMDGAGAQYNRQTNSQIYVTPSLRNTHKSFSLPGRNAAQLLDAADPATMNMMRGDTPAERVRKRLAERERETEVVRQLSAAGSGAGGEYMRLRQERIDNTTSSQGSNGSQQQTQSDTASQRLGQILQGKAQSAAQVHLSPIKKSRPVVSGHLLSDTSSDSGNPRKRKSRAISPSKSSITVDRKSTTTTTTSSSMTSSARKKTRFVTDKGIREAGRESLGTPGRGGGNNRHEVYDDDDELEIEG